ncbi:PD40 domain-containing protein [bacterium]|nr:PD40 domain-containing protein [bacterium]
MRMYVAFSVMSVVCLSMLGCQKSDTITVDTSREISESRIVTKKRPADKEEKTKLGIKFTRITKVHEYDSAPAFSPDGTKIAYASYQNDAQNIWIIDSEGKEEPKRITHTATLDNRPTWSADGKSIIFSSTKLNDNAGSKLYIVNSNGTNLRQLDKGVDGYSPSCSPLDEQIVFVSQNNLRIIKGVDDKEPNYITTKGYQDYPCWMDNAKKVLFFCDDDLHLININERSTTRLTDTAWNSFPSVSFKTNKIAFVSNRGGNYDLWVMSGDGTNLVQITNDKYNELYPCFSSDGSKIAFQSDKSGNFDIWVVELPENI